MVGRVLKRCSVRQPLPDTRRGGNGGRIFFPDHAQRRCQAWNISTVQSAYCQFRRPVWCSWKRWCTYATSNKPLTLRACSERSSAAHSLSGPRIHWPSGMPKPVSDARTARPARDASAPAAGCVCNVRRCQGSRAAGAMNIPPPDGRGAVLGLRATLKCWRGQPWSGCRPEDIASYRSSVSARPGPEGLWRGRGVPAAVGGHDRTV